MSNISDYLGWRGDITFAERPFNDVDNIILSTFCYLDLRGIAPGPRESPQDELQTIALSKACQQLLKEAKGNMSKYVRSLCQIDSRFVDLLSSARRFAPVQIHSYADVVDNKRALQFSAMQLDLPNNETYVAFRGTDNTLVGWREDFMLSFTVTEAQREAARYLSDAVALARERGRKLHVGGHSKGGNLAEYAATCCTDEERAQLHCIYSNDGPCMAPEVTPVDSREVLGSRLKRIVPTYSVVGMLFAQPDDPRVIVRSSELGPAQHDSMSWQVMRAGVKEAIDLEPDCKVIGVSINKWSKSIPLSERKRMTNELFDALGAGGANTIDEIASSTDGLREVYRALKSSDERTRKLVNDLLNVAVQNSVDAARKTAQDTLDQWRKDALDAAGGVVKKLRESTLTIG